MSSSETKSPTDDPINDKNIFKFPSSQDNFINPLAFPFYKWPVNK